MSANSQIHVLLFTDLLDSSALKGPLGDAGYVEHVARPHNQIFRSILARFPDAVENNFTGDGFLATFPRVSDAVNAALLFHHGLYQHAWDDSVRNATGGAGVRSRAAIHMGESVVMSGTELEDPIIASHAADMCARLMSLAAGGQTLLTRAAFDNARQFVREHPAVESVTTSPGLEWLAHGRYLFKGKDEPMEVFEVGAVNIAPLVAPGDSEKAQRADSLEEASLRGWRPAAEQEVPGRPGWHIIDKLGEGGFGEVWLARHAKTKERRVFKFCFDVDRVRSFKRELTFFRLLREALGERDDIARILDVRLDQSPYFLESEYVEGGNLRGWVDRQGGLANIPMTERLRLLAAVARAVAAAHSIGVIHKDLKPSNIFVQSRQGRPAQPMIADFGIGAMADCSALEKHQITAAGFTDSLMVPPSSRTGTRLYAPPEAQVGKGGTTAADVYALGVMLYQLAVADFDRPLASGWERDVSDELLRGDIAACVDGDPARRLPSPVELADRLDSLEDRRAAVIRRRDVERAARRTQLLRQALAGALAALVVVGGLGIFGFVQWKRAEDEAGRAKLEAHRATEEKHRADQNAEESRRHLYGAQMNRAQANWEGYHVPQVLDLLEQTKPDRGEIDLRGFEWYYQERLCNNDLRTLKGHTNAVTSVAFSPDGMRSASASWDNKVKLWDAATGAEFRTLDGHIDVVNSVTFSPDGTLLASASSDKTIKLWDALTGAELRTLKGHASVVTSVAFSTDGTRLASASKDMTVKLWEVSTGAEQATLKRHTSDVTSVAFSPDGTRLASASADQTVKLWDAATGSEQRTLKGHGSAVIGVAFSPDGTCLASASRDKTVMLWDATTGATQRILKGHTSDVTGVAFSPDGTRLASASSDKTLKLWDATTGAEQRTLRGHTSDVTGVAFSLDGTRLASASADQTVKLWDGAICAELRTFKGHANTVTCVAFSPDGTRLASASEDKTVKLWNAANGALVRTLNGHTSDVTCVAFSPDGNRLVSASRDETVKLWEAATGAELRRLDGHKNTITSVAFSSDGTCLASASSDKTARLWDAVTGAKLRTLTGHTDSVTGVAFSPDGTLLASASEDQTVKLWDVATGAELRTLKRYGRVVSSLAFSPDGTRLALACRDETLRLCDVAAGAELRTFKGHTDIVKCVAFSPDGTRLASVSLDQTVKLWDAATGAELHTLKGSTPWGASVAFSPDGTRLASAGWDKTVKVWDARPLTPQIRIELEAYGLVQFYLEKNLTKADAANRLRAHKAITEDVRKEALRIAELFWKAKDS